MRVLMLSIDKGLLGQGQLGDVVERHKKYGEFCERLDIIVFSLIYPERSASWRRVEGSRSGIKLSDKVTSYPTNSCCKLKYYFDALKLGKKLCDENGYNLIVCQDPFLIGLVGLKLKKKYGVKLLIHFHGDYKFPFWYVVKNADGVRVMSQGQLTRLHQGYGGQEKNIRVIPTPINLEKFLSFKSTRRFNHEGKIILFVGRLEKVKKLDWLLKAFKKLLITHYLPRRQAGSSPITLKIIGDGPLKNDLQNLAKKLNISDKVEFLGQLPQDKIIEHYYNSDIVVLPSQSESFGKVLVEANACGKPVVSTATTGAKEIVEDGVNGFLVPIGDAKALAEKIIYLLENPELARQMGERGRQMALEKYSHNTQKIVEFWQDIIK